MIRCGKYAMFAGLILAGCNGRDGESPDPPLFPERSIACAVDGSAEFKNVCTIDRVSDARGTLLTVHQPDGGFHRLRVADDGTGIIAADGAMSAQTRVVGSEIEVTIGNARYRLPMIARK